MCPLFTSFLKFSHSAKKKSLLRRYADLPGSSSRDPRTSDEMHDEINRETITIFTYLQLVRVQIIIENLEFSHGPSRIVPAPVYGTQASKIGRKCLN